MVHNASTVKSVSKDGEEYFKVKNQERWQNKEHETEAVIGIRCLL